MWDEFHFVTYIAAWIHACLLSPCKGWYNPFTPTPGNHVYVIRPRVRIVVCRGFSVVLYERFTLSALCVCCAGHLKKQVKVPSPGSSEEATPERTRAELSGLREEMKEAHTEHLRESE